MNVHILRYGTKTVSRVKVSVARNVRESSPQTLTGVLEEDAAKIVQVASAAVKQLTKASSTHHIQHEHFVIPVATILHDQAMPARFLGRINELPAFRDGVGYWDFDTGVFPIIHRGQGHRNVPVPGRRDVYEIDIGAPTEILEVALAIAIGCG
jgi:hypothetical protein